MGREGNTGYVKWPTKPRKGLRRGNEGGGMWVSAFWRCHYVAVGSNPADAGLTILDPPHGIPRIHDPFVTCVGPDSVIGLSLPDAVASPNVDDIYPYRFPESPSGRHAAWEEREGYLRSVLLAGVPVLASVCLGSSSSTWFDETGTAWYANFGDLTRRGKRVVTALERMYGRTADLVTYLDT